MYTDYDYIEDLSNEEYSDEIKCPGKEITGMVMGITSILYVAWSVLYITIMAIDLLSRSGSYTPDFVAYLLVNIIFIFTSLASAVVAIILFVKTKKQATVTTVKTKVGLILGIIGCAAGVLNCIILIVLTIVVLS